MDFPLHFDLQAISATDMGQRLLLAPFYCMDGINEHGLVVAVAADKQTTIKPSKDKERIFITCLLRKILDKTKTVDEAVNLAENYAPFILDTMSLASHLLIADSSGRSVVLEYDQDQWRKVYGDKSWQAMSTKTLYNVSDSIRREECWRYRTMSQTLEGELDNDWEYGMKLLQDVSQAGTTWSVVYSPTTKELYFSVYQQWETVYHLKFP
jgi:penicillin V acylase-like amidase (Ntn superfamily)